MDGIRMKVMVAILVMLFFCLAIYGEPVRFRYVWNWEVNEPGIVAFRYKIGEDAEEWTEIGAEDTLSVGAESGFGPLRLYLQQSYDRVRWSETSGWVTGMPKPPIFGNSHVVPSGSVDESVDPLQRAGHDVGGIPISGDDGHREMLIAFHLNFLFASSVVPKTPSFANFNVATAPEEVLDTIFPKEERTSRIWLKYTAGVQYAVAEGPAYDSYYLAYDRLQPTVTLGISAENLFVISPGRVGIGFETSIVYTPYLMSAGSNNPTGSVNAGVDWHLAAWHRFSHIFGISLFPQLSFGLNDMLTANIFAGVLTTYPSKDAQGEGWTSSLGNIGWSAGLGLRRRFGASYGLSLDISLNWQAQYRYNISGRFGLSYLL